MPRSLTKAITASVQSINQRFKTAKVDCEFKEKRAIMNADRFLETLFIYLLENAIIHNPRDDKKVWIKLRKDSSGFEISISDNGLGIDDDRKTQEDNTTV